MSQQLAERGQAFELPELTPASHTARWASPAGTGRDTPASECQSNCHLK